MKLLVIASVIFIVGPSFQGKARNCKRPKGYPGDYAECRNGRWTLDHEYASLEKIEKGVEMNGQKLDELLSGSGERQMVVSGRSNNDVNDPLISAAYHVVTNEADFQLGKNSNLWITDDDKTGADSNLYMTFASKVTISGFLIKNTHNAGNQDRGTNQFKILASNSSSGPWTEILANNLPNAINVTNVNVPTLKFDLGSPITAQFVIFQIETFYGLGGGLQFLSTF